MKKNKPGLSRQLLTRVLSVYFLVTMIVTSVHVISEYFDARKNVENELIMLKNTFLSSLTIAVWELNSPQVNSIAEGLLEQSTVTGVQIWDETGKPIAVYGSVDTGRRPSNRSELISHPAKRDLIYSFPLVYSLSGQRVEVANMSLYSNNQIIFERIKVSLFFLVANAIIKSTFLVVLFLSAFRKFLTEPLSELTHQIDKFDVTKLEDSKLHLSSTNNYELGTLQNNYNKLIDNLISFKRKLLSTEDKLKTANQQLDNHNIQLEQEVERKTSSLNAIMLDLEGQRNTLMQKQVALEEEIIRRAQAEELLIEKNQALATSMEALQLAQDRLIESERMASLGGLVAGITHDVNTPIGVSVTASSFLQERLDKIEAAYDEKTLTNLDMSLFISEARQTTTLLTNNLNRALSLLASFKQVAVDQTSEAERQINLHTYVSEVIESLAPTFKRTQHQIDLICPEPIVFVCPPGAIAQIITNLIMNSLKHGFEEIDAGKITITLKADNNDVFIDYTDDGKGIAEKDINSHFDAFVTSKRSEGGSGLGTHIMYNLVTQTLHGDISLQSGHNKGVHYSISFPKTV